MQNNIEKNSDIAKGICFVLLSAMTIAISIVYVYRMNYALDSLEILDRGKWRTLTIYLTGMVIFAGLFLAINVIVYFLGIFFEKHRGVAALIAQIAGVNLNNKVQIAVIIAPSFIGAILLYNYFFVNQRTEGGYNSGCFYNIPDLIWKIAIIILIIFTAYMILKKADIENAEKYVFYAATIIIVFALTFITNPFVEADNPARGYFAAFINFNITWESIYNVIDGVPYTYDTTPLYGHYALFFLPVKLVSKQHFIIAISFIFAFTAAIGQLATLYVINSFSKKNWMSVLLALGSMARLEYYIVHLIPIRTIFPILLCAFFTFLYKRKIKVTKRQGWYVAFFVLLTLSVLCNLEMGVVCLLTFGTYVIFELICDRGPLKEWVSNIIFVIVTLIMSIIAAIGIVNLYNLANGGPVVGRSFFFPMTGCDVSIVEYIQDHFHWPVPLGNTAWIYILAFLLGSLCTVWYVAIMKKNGGGKKNTNSVVPILGAMVCMEIFSFAYYMNEPLWTDLSIYTAVIICIFAIVIDRIYFVLEGKYQTLGHQFLRIIAILIIGVTICGAVQVINDPGRIAARKWAGAYDRESLEAQVDAIDIPEDTYGFGQGVNMIYHMLGLENHMKYRDTSELDMPRSETFEMVINDLKQEDYVFVGTSYAYDIQTLEKLEERGFTFTPEQTFQIGSYEYSYCRLEYSE